MSKISEPRKVVIVGGGRAGRNANDVFRAMSLEVAGFLDDTKLEGTKINGISVLGGFGLLEDAHFLGAFDFFVALGDNEARCRVARRIGSSDGRLVSAIHPTSTISPHAQIGVGVYFSVNTSVLANASIGDFVYVAAMSTIGEESIIKEGVMIGPGCSFTGACRVGPFTQIGAGAVITDGGPIGAHTRIGAGATVVSKIPDRVLALGTPARVTRHLP